MNVIKSKWNDHQQTENNYHIIKHIMRPLQYAINNIKIQFESDSVATSVIEHFKLCNIIKYILKSSQTKSSVTTN